MSGATAVAVTLVSAGRKTSISIPSPLAEGLRRRARERGCSLIEVIMRAFLEFGNEPLFSKRDDALAQFGITPREASGVPHATVAFAAPEQALDALDELAGANSTSRSALVGALLERAFEAAEESD